MCIFPLLVRELLCNLNLRIFPVVFCLLTRSHWMNMCLTYCSAAWEPKPTPGSWQRTELSSMPSSGGPTISTCKTHLRFVVCLSLHHQTLGQATSIISPQNKRHKLPAGLSWSPFLGYNLIFIQHLG